MAPQLKITLRGEFSSFDGTNWTAACTQTSAQTFSVRSVLMVDNINSVLAERCPDGVQLLYDIRTATTTLTTEAMAGFTTVDFFFASASPSTHDAVWNCAMNVAYYAEDQFNWGFPILPAAPGCPFANFDPPRFYHNQNEWFCQGSALRREQSLPGYYSPDRLIRLTSNYVTIPEGADMSFQCAQAYQRQLQVRAAWQRDTVADMINEGTLCGAYAGITTGTISTEVTTRNNVGEVAINLGIQGARAQTFDDVIACGGDVADYISPLSVWGFPIFISEPGCPYPFIESQSFEADTDWLC